MTAVEILAELLAVKELRAEHLRLKQRRENSRWSASPAKLAELAALKADADRRWPLAWAAAQRLVDAERAATRSEQ